MSLLVRLGRRVLSEAHESEPNTLALATAEELADVAAAGGGGGGGDGNLGQSTADAGPGLAAGVHQLGNVSFTLAEEQPVLFLAILNGGLDLAGLKFILDKPIGSNEELAVIGAHGHAFLPWSRTIGTIMAAGGNPQQDMIGVITTDRPNTYGTGIRRHLPPGEYECFWEVNVVSSVDPIAHRVAVLA